MKNLFATAILFISSLSFANSQETILGTQITEDGVAFRVHTGGCTSKDSFELTIDESKGNIELELDRTQPDYCLALYPNGTVIEYSWDELDLIPQPVTVLNPIKTVEPIVSFQ